MDNKMEVQNFNSQSLQPCSCEERLLRIEEVLDRLAISRATLYKEIRKGRIPEPKKIGAASRWRNSDICKVIND